ncbi:uncharacterized protein RAG0_02304 [Rhynchosporium agropyri]|uniref:Uncharacterized protein n=2 Tax=Rhynchosporium TaxID=38037 RepID=A0A1E1K0Y6_9HELO|nr:uncharacterized protein RCO7_14230 [Rhynchosporium commune]CZS91776.1 uncharacterized protein RAG0_02304 [Rhynchosporium agropyri]
MIESRPAKLRTKALNRATTRQDAFVFSVLMNALTQKIFPPVYDEAIK